MVRKRKIRASGAIDAEVTERMSVLAELLPVLRGADGVRPWNPGALARWAETKRAAALVLRRDGLERAYSCVIVVLLLATCCNGMQGATLSPALRADLQRSEIGTVFQNVGPEERDVIMTWVWRSMMQDPKAFPLEPAIERIHKAEQRALEAHLKALEERVRGRAKKAG
jgi:hypothetical protein